MGIPYIKVMSVEDYTECSTFFGSEIDIVFILFHFVTLIVKTTSSTRKEINMIKMLKYPLNYFKLVVADDCLLISCKSLNG